MISQRILYRSFWHGGLKCELLLHPDGVMRVIWHPCRPSEPMDPQLRRRFVRARELLRQEAARVAAATHVDGQLDHADRSPAPRRTGTPR